MSSIDGLDGLGQRADQLGAGLLAIRDRQRQLGLRRAIGSENRHPDGAAGDAERADSLALDDRRHQLGAQRARERAHRLAVGLLLDVVADRLLAGPVDVGVVRVAVDQVEEATERRLGIRSLPTL